MSEDFAHSVENIREGDIPTRKSERMPTATRSVDEILGNHPGDTHPICRETGDFPEVLVQQVEPITKDGFGEIKKLKMFRKTLFINYKSGDGRVFAYVVLKKVGSSSIIISAFCVYGPEGTDCLVDFLAEAPEKYHIDVDCPNYNSLLNYFTRKSGI